jgi:hypothetical protein
MTRPAQPAAVDAGGHRRTPDVGGRLWTSAACCLVQDARHVDVDAWSALRRDCSRGQIGAGRGAS